MSGKTDLKLTKAELAYAATYGPWAIVTGASKGIGAEMAKELARLKMNLVLVARDGHALETLAGELVDTTGIEVKTISADLSTEDGINAVFTGTKGLDVGLFVANAGFGTSGPFIDGDLGQEVEMIDLNVGAVAKMTHHYGNVFASSTRDRSGIIMLSSIVSWQGVPGSANYAATKAWVQSFTEAIHKELKPLGIDVTAAAPAQVSTAFMERAKMKADGADPATVARNTLYSLGKKTTAFPDFNSWFLSTSLAFLPRPIRVNILQGVMAGMTKAYKADEAA